METEISPYYRQVHYYETDRMGIVHHSNYIRWMEEARFDYMRRAGISYAVMEQGGIIMPVVDVTCRYHASARFDELIRIEVKLTAFNGVRCAFSYEMFLEKGTLACTGTSSHCFLDEGSRMPVNLKRRDPEFYTRALALLEETDS